MFRSALLRYTFQLSIRKPNTAYLKDILVNDPAEVDILINDISVGALKNDISPFLEIPYLSNCPHTSEQIRATIKYHGVIIGDHSRLFLSIPTKHPNLNNLLYVHYLLDTGSPFTTLTHQALCALHGKRYSPQLTFTRGFYIVGGQSIQIHLSNPDPHQKMPTHNHSSCLHNYHNVNILGMNFLRKFKLVKQQLDFRSQKFELELIEPIN